LLLAGIFSRPPAAQRFNLPPAWVYYERLRGNILRGGVKMALSGEEKVNLKEELAAIRAAQTRLAGVISTTRLLYSRAYSEEAGNSVYLKPENLQATGSFKIRGAYNKIAQIAADGKKKGLIAASAGNHAQGVAYAAQTLGAKATIVMPKRTPLIKVEATRGYGAGVILAGDDYDEAYEVARNLEDERGYIFIHPFNDWDIIAGQGTIGLEIIAERPDADYILVPVGGGGLISGIAVAAKALRPAIKIIGIEPEGASSMQMSLRAGAPTRLERMDTIADGVAVRKPGGIPFSIVRQLADEIITVPDNELTDAFLLLLERHKLLAESSGLLPLAALSRLPAAGKKVVCVISGGNIDVMTMAAMLRLGLANRGRMFCFSVELRDIPGELLKISHLLAGQNANILKIDHDQFKALDRFRKVRVEVTVETNGADHVQQISAILRQEGYEAVKVY
jgi:threonine dehydratase